MMLMLWLCCVALLGCKERLYQRMIDMAGAAASLAPWTLTSGPAAADECPLVKGQIRTVGQ